MTTKKLFGRGIEEENVVAEKKTGPVRHALTGEEIRAITNISQMYIDYCVSKRARKPRLNVVFLSVVKNLVRNIFRSETVIKLADPLKWELDLSEFVDFEDLNNQYDEIEAMENAGRKPTQQQPPQHGGLIKDELEEEEQEQEETEAQTNAQNPPADTQASDEALEALRRKMTGSN